MEPNGTIEPIYFYWILTTANDYLKAPSYKWYFHSAKALVIFFRQYFIPVLRQTLPRIWTLPWSARR